MAIVLREALDILSLSYPRLTSEGFGARFMDEVLSTMWVKYPWKQSIAKLPPFHPINQEADYGAPTSAIPTDFFALHDVWLKNSYHYEKELSIVANLKPSYYVGEPEAISYIPEVPAFRLYPRPNLNPPYWWIEGRYKKKPTRVTDLTLSSATFPFDDLYFSVMRQGMYWKYQSEIVKDPRSTEQYSLFLAMLREMAISEGVHQGAHVVHPEFELSFGG